MPTSQRMSQFVAPSAWADRSTGICPGYLISLPQVIEVARLHPWWEHGQLTTRIQGQPTTLLMDGLDLLQGEINAVESYVIDKASSREP